MYVGKQFRVREAQSLVFVAGIVRGVIGGLRGVKPHGELHPRAQIAHIAHAVHIGLPLEHARDALHGVGLVLLYLKAEFHGRFSLLLSLAVLFRRFTVSKLVALKSDDYRRGVF